jgi:hypothetical protein
VDFYLNNKHLIEDPNSAFLREAVCHAKIREISESQSKGLLHLYESLFGAITTQKIEKFKLDHPEYDYVALDIETKKKYPLLRHINSYNIRHSPDIASHIAQYVNLLDKI